jgi:hypothetical protein
MTYQRHSEGECEVLGLRRSEDQPQKSQDSVRSLKEMSDPGSESKKTRDSARYGEIHTERVVHALMALDRMMHMHQVESYGLRKISMRLGVVDYTDTLVTIVMVDEEGAEWVGFHGALSPSEALMGAINRVVNGTMKWRKSKPYERGE